MHILQTIILGLVEGFTEFLPISSTAHLLIAARIMHLSETDFLKTFQIVIQFGAILAIVAIYSRRFYRLYKVWPKILVAFVPTGIIGFLFYKSIKVWLAGPSLALWALGIGGALLVLFEIFYKDKNPARDSMEELAALSYTKAIAIGCAQAVSVIPGVSRAAATIVAGRMLGVSRGAIVEFSFLLAAPTIFAASGYELLKSTAHLSASQYGLIALGLLVSFASAYFSVRWFLRYIQNHNFIIFGLYRVLIAFMFIPFL